MKTKSVIMSQNNQVTTTNPDVDNVSIDRTNSALFRGDVPTHNMSSTNSVAIPVSSSNSSSIVIDMSDQESTTPNAYQRHPSSSIVPSAASNLMNLSEFLESNASNTSAGVNDDQDLESNDNGDGTNEEDSRLLSSLREFFFHNSDFNDFFAMKKIIPFIMLLFLKFFFDHFTGILIGICLTTTFFHANSVVKQQVSRQAKRNICALLAVLINMVACITFIYLFFDQEKFYRYLVFLPCQSSVKSFYDLFWLVCVNDFILKFYAVIFKIGVILLPNSFVKYPYRGKYFLFIERLNQLHREIVPTTIWMNYFFESWNSLMNKIFCVILILFYSMNKIYQIVSYLKPLKIATQNLFQRTNFGRRATKDQIKDDNYSCPICYEDYRNPIILRCKHIFCEDCLCIWFDREKTCPLCRHMVTDDPKWKDGSTSQYLQLF